MIESFITLYVLNLLFSICSIIGIFIFHVHEEYLLLPFYNYYYFYWFIAFSSFLYSFVELGVFCQSPVLMSSNVLLFVNIFLGLTWLSTSIVSSIFLDACQKSVNKCDIIIFLNVFSYLELCVWTFIIVLYIRFIRNNKVVTIRAPERELQNEQEPQMREIPDRRGLSVHSPLSIQSQRPEIVDIEMEDIKL